MSLPELVTREQWTAARVALLEQEKALTKARDELAAARRRLPMVEVTEDYRFTAEDGGERGLLDLFEGRRQLILEHYRFDPDSGWLPASVAPVGMLAAQDPPVVREPQREPVGVERLEQRLGVPA